MCNSLIWEWFASARYPFPAKGNRVHFKTPTAFVGFRHGGFLQMGNVKSCIVYALHSLICNFPSLLLFYSSYQKYNRLTLSQVTGFWFVSFLFWFCGLSRYFYFIYDVFLLFLHCFYIASPAYFRDGCHEYGAFVGVRIEEFMVLLYF